MASSKQSGPKAPASAIQPSTVVAIVAALALLTSRLYYQSLVAAQRGESGTEYLAIILFPFDVAALIVLVVILCWRWFGGAALPPNGFGCAW